MALEPPTARMAEDATHVIWTHRCRDHNGLPTENWLPLDSNGWKVLSLAGDPITVRPSILCHACGTHGWITDGYWVPA